MEIIENEKIRRECLLVRGIDIEKVEEGKENPSEVESEVRSEQEVMFKDPSEYQHLSEEEKKRLTEEMKEKLSNLPSIAKGFGNIKNAGR